MPPTAGVSRRRNLSTDCPMHPVGAIADPLGLPAGALPARQLFDRIGIVLLHPARLAESMTLSPGIWRRGAVASIIALTALVGAYAGTMYLTGNIHTVVPGELYRSATLTPAQLEDTLRTRG